MRTCLMVVVLAASGVAWAGEKPSLEGRWSSPSCGKRSYERRITFTVADGTFRADERISPCPPDVACVWSGIVTRRGTFEVKGAVVKLTAEKTEATQGEPLPATLSWKRGALSEKGGCAYKKHVPDPDDPLAR